jgi:3-isopropylmalate/(R)-2-methylmalate dehydratase small subunit
MQSFTQLHSTIAVLDHQNIDTDQIISSEHLKITDKKGLGQHLFSDWRYHSTGENDLNFVLNKKTTKNSQVLVVGDNFGCGSSREHAPWALLDYGIRVVISSSIADIFSNNAVQNGLLTIQIPPKAHHYLLSMNAKNIAIDLNQQTISCEDTIISFSIQPFSKYCLSHGFSPLDFLLHHIKEIEKYEI